MITHWNKLLNTKCEVVAVGGRFIYPIFKVGHTSLMSVAEKIYTDDEIKECDHIDIMIRNPRQRFISGINEYSHRNSIDVDTTWKMIKQGKLLDRHFAPQYVWLIHLYKFYRGNITLRSFDFIKQVTSTHKIQNSIKRPVPVIDSFVKVDELLIREIGKRQPLEHLIRRYKNALS